MKKMSHIEKLYTEGDMKFEKIYDLSVPIYHNCPEWPDFPLTVVERMMFIPHDIANVEKLTTPTHVGTHVDVPYHMFEEGKTLDQIPVETWVGEGVVINLSFKKDKEFITEADMEKAGSHVKRGDIVVLYTGYGKYRGYNRKYQYDWPALNESGAKWLVACGVKFVGVDTLGIERYGFPEGGPVVHKAILGVDIPIVEELKLDEIAQKGDKRWLFVCLPILLKGAGGCAARMIAIDQG